MPRKPRPLWRCPKCGKYYVTRNMWHACARHTVAEHFAHRDPKLRLLFDGVVGLLKRCGSLRVVPGKTGIAFQVRMRFAGVVVRRDSLHVAFILPRRLDHPRVREVIAYSPRAYGHHVEVRTPADLDTELAGWLRAAYRVGQQAELLAGKKTLRQAGDFSWSEPVFAPARKSNLTPDEHRGKRSRGSPATLLSGPGFSPAITKASSILPQGLQPLRPAKTKSKAPLPRCPKCGRRLPMRNQMHICSSLTLDEFLAHKTPHAVALFRKLVALVRRLGPLEIVPQKTRVAFLARKTFLGVRFLRDALDLELTLPHRIEHPRFRQILSISPRSHYHSLRLSSPRDLDRLALAWLKAAYSSAK